MLVKILSEDLITRKFQYKLGKNADINPLSKADNYAKGLHFCEVKSIEIIMSHLMCLSYGKLAIVHVDDEETVIRYNNGYNNEYRSHTLCLLCRIL